MIFFMIIFILPSNLLISSSFYDYFFSTPPSPEERYQKIIESWSPQYWHVQGFKANDMQTLSKAIQEDINAQKMSIEKLPIIFTTLESYPIQERYKQECKQALQIVQKRIKPEPMTSSSPVHSFEYDKNSTVNNSSYLRNFKFPENAIPQLPNLEQIHDKIFALSQPQYDGQKANIMKSVGEIQTTDQYIQSIKNDVEIKIRSKRQIEPINFEIMNNNLKDFNFVIDSRGDGNCGYRSVIISSYMDYPTKMNNYFKELLEHRFVQLFMQYDRNFEFENRDKQNIGILILTYLLSVLESMKKYKTIDDFIKILNKEITFDYYMIMFMRYILADYITKNDPQELLFSDDPKDKILKNTLTWRNELDHLETILLANATTIQIQTIQQDAQQNAIVITQNIKPVGHAYILFTRSPGHYQILVKDHVKQLPPFTMKPIKIHKTFL